MSGCDSREMDAADRRRTCLSSWRSWGSRTGAMLSPRAFGWHAAACDDCHARALDPESNRGRADDRARRGHPAPDHPSRSSSPRPPRLPDRVHYPRPVTAHRAVRPHRDHVRRARSSRRPRPRTSTGVRGTRTPTPCCTPSRRCAGARRELGRHPRQPARPGAARPTGCPYREPLPRSPGTPCGAVHSGAPAPRHRRGDDAGGTAAPRAEGRAADRRDDVGPRGDPRDRAAARRAVGRSHRRPRCRRGRSAPPRSCPRRRPPPPRGTLPPHPAPARRRRGSPPWRRRGARARSTFSAPPLAVATSSAIRKTPCSPRARGHGPAMQSRGRRLRQALRCQRLRDRTHRVHLGVDQQALREVYLAPFELSSAPGCGP